MTLFGRPLVIVKDDPLLNPPDGSVVGLAFTMQMGTDWVGGVYR